MEHPMARRYIERSGWCIRRPSACVTVLLGAGLSNLGLIGGPQSWPRMPLAGGCRVGSSQRRLVARAAKRSEERAAADRADEAREPADDDRSKRHRHSGDPQRKILLGLRYAGRMDDAPDHQDNAQSVKDEGGRP